MKSAVFSSKFLSLWIQQERLEELSKLLLDFLKSLSVPAARP